MKIFLCARAHDLENGYLRGLVPDLLEAGTVSEVVTATFPFGANEHSHVTSKSFRQVSIHFFTSQSDKISSEAVEIAAQFLSSGESRRILNLSLKLLNRVDFSGTFRLIDREATVRFAFLKIIDLLVRERPQLIVFMSTPHLFGEFLLHELAQFLGIGVLFFQPSPICAAMIPRTSLRDRIAPSRPIRGLGSIGKQIENSTLTSIESLFQGVSPGYIQRQKHFSEAAMGIRGKLRTIRHSLRWLQSPRFRESQDFSGSAISNYLLQNFLSALLSSMLQRRLVNEIRSISGQITPNRYALFALHYEPERTSIPEGLPIEFQFDAIMRARRLLPLDIPLVVKEHYSQSSPSLRGFLGRSPLFYDLVKSVPNVFLVGPGTDAVRLLEKSVCIFTLTGTIAIEAVGRGIPAAYFGSPWWEGMPGSIRVDDSTCFEDISGVGLPNRDQLEKFFLDLVGTGMIAGIASEDPQDYQTRHGQLPEDFWVLVREAVFSQIDSLARDLTEPDTRIREQ